MGTTRIEALRQKARKKLLLMYSSGVPVPELQKRFGYSYRTIQEIIEDFRSGKMNIFGENTKRRIMEKINSKDEEIKQLQSRIIQLEHDLKMSELMVEGYEIMQRLYKEETGIDISKKCEAGPSKSLRKVTKK